MDVVDGEEPAEGNHRLPERVGQPPETDGRRTYQVLIDRRFGTFFVGKLASLMGLWVVNITSALLIFELTNSAFLVGLVTVLQFTPQIVFSPWIGALIDRKDRRRVVMMGQTLTLVGTLGLGIWLLAAGVEGLPGLWPIFATALFAGLGNAVTSPSTQSLIPALVPRADLFAGITLNSSIASLSRAVGPALGALVYVGLGPAAGFITGAVGNLLLIAAMALVRPEPAPKDSGGDTSILGGFRYLRRTPAMLALLLCVAAVGFGVDVTITLTPSLAAELGQGEVFVGTLASVFGVGALAAILLSSPLDRRWGLSGVGVVGLGLMSIGFLGLAASPGADLALVGIGIAGAGFLLSSSSLTSRIQELVPDVFRGRVMAIWAVGYFGSRPIAATINGAVADAVSARFALLITVVVTGVAAYFTYTTAKWIDRD
ncbi:MAG: MFS transporter [Acidimicrobiia bacterium]